MTSYRKTLTVTTELHASCKQCCSFKIL